MSDLLMVLLVMNLMAAAAVAVVMALRLPARRLFGARVAYGLWSLVPLAALGILLPSRVVTVAAPQTISGTLLPLPPAVDTVGRVAASAPQLDVWATAALLWITGGFACVAWLAWRQHQFARALRDGRAGPAVIGVLRPRIITPDDFAGLYTPREQQVVLAHEATHIARHDVRANALVALARCINWFNPAVHVLAHYLRIDQELACDAQVVAAHPQARRAYAEAMLKAQLAARPLPLGCYWPAQAAHPLADRIRLLAQTSPSRLRRTAGRAAVALLALSCAGAAWAAKPARILVAAAPPPPVAAPASEAPTLPVRPADAAPKPKPAAKVATADAAPAPQPAPLTPETAVQAAQADAAPLTQPPPWAYARSRTRAAMRPLISPGSAVRVTAATVDPDGVALSSDMTSFGSNPLRRKGSYQRAGSRYGLYTSVFQQGDHYWVTASVTYARQPVVAGGVSLASGETGQIQLANGQVVTVTATARPETSEETQMADAAVDVREVASAARDRTQRDRPRALAPIY